MNKRHQRSLRIRVEHEPNRYSDDCLERIYEQLHPTKSREVTPDKNNKQGELGPQRGKGGRQ
jgi:hypothetical protein